MHIDILKLLKQEFPDFDPCFLPNVTLVKWHQFLVSQSEDSHVTVFDNTVSLI